MIYVFSHGFECLELLYIIQLDIVSVVLVS